MKILKEEFFVPYGADETGAIVRLNGSQAWRATEYRCSLDVVIEGIEHHVRQAIPAYEVGRWAAIDYARAEESIRRDTRWKILRMIESVLFPDA